MSSSHYPRVVIIGLDGADWSLLQPLFADGAMPTLEAFVKGGVSGPLESVLPTNSMSAWTSAMTGVNPGKHGLFSFVRKSGTPYDTLVTNSTCIRFPTIYETLTSAGLSSCVIDVPPFYPPFQIDGVMLGGMGVLGPQALSYPQDAAATVLEKAGGYADDVPWLAYQGRADELVDRLVTLTDNRLRIAEVMLDERPFDLFTVVFVAPDRAQHAFCRDILAGGRHYATARRLYAALDAALARLLDRIDTAETDVLIVSDHGFRPVRKMVSINQILADAGLLRSTWRERLSGRAMPLALRLPDRFQKPIFQYLERARWGSQRRLLPGSVAYSEIADTVDVNLVGRESTGSVPASDYESTVESVAAALTQFRDPSTGQAPLRRAIRREKYFQGELAAEAPDLVLEYEDGYAYIGALGNAVWEWRWLQGVHSRTGIIAGLGPHFAKGTEAPTLSILDVAPTALALLDIAPPAGVDGRVAEELLTARPAVARPAVGPPQPREKPKTYSEEEEAKIRERLRGLGYIE
jgi:predicted AlkP superfamily phosphohydrolase/phosphomutase